MHVLSSPSTRPCIPHSARPQYHAPSMPSMRLNRGVVRHRGRVAHAQAVAPSSTDTPTIQQTPEQQQFMQDMIEFLKEDLQHLFDDQGIDASKYDDVVDFIDPITRYNNLGGYLFNIQMLRYVFAPDYIMHDIKQTGPWEITTRWTMDMRFTPIDAITPLAKVWRPKLLFTGVSIMQINPETKKFNRHIDIWDAVDNNSYFSAEAAAHVFSQLFNFMRTPQIESPKYTVLRKTKDYEIRQYQPFIAASAPMTLPARNPEQSSKGTGAFQAIAGYIFGGNDAGEKIAMTTPVLTTRGGTMQFMMPSVYTDPSTLPSPKNEAITLQSVPSMLYAAATFSGLASEEIGEEKCRELQKKLQQDGYTYTDAWVLARYNDPSTKPPFRRNEVLVPVTNFDVWGPVETSE